MKKLKGLKALTKLRINGHVMMGSPGMIVANSGYGEFKKTHINEIKKLKSLTKLAMNCTSVTDLDCITDSETVTEISKLSNLT